MKSCEMVPPVQDSAVAILSPDFFKSFTTSSASEFESVPYITSPSKALILKIAAEQSLSASSSESAVAVIDISHSLSLQ